MRASKRKHERAIAEAEEALFWEEASVGLGLSTVKAPLEANELVIVVLVLSASPCPTNTATVILYLTQQAMPSTLPIVVTLTLLAETPLNARIKTLIVCSSGRTQVVAFWMQNLTITFLTTLIVGGTGWSQLGPVKKGVWQT